MDINVIASYCESLWGTRETINPKLDEIASFVAPDRQGFTAGKMTESDEGRGNIWDSTPEDAAVTLSSALHGMLTNPATDWLELTLVGAEDTEDTETTNFVSTATKTMMDVFSDPETGFHNEVNAFYFDFPTIGWAVILVEYKDGKGIQFTTVPPTQCAIAENADGRVDTVLRRWTRTPGQLVEEFGEANVSDKVKETLENKSAHNPVAVSHLVIPQAKLPRDTNAKGKKNSRAFLSVTFETETKQVLRQGFFDELPFMVPRWSKRSGEVYGRGPGHAALPDMRVLNRVAYTQLVGAEKLADPPIAAASDSVVGKIRTHAGGITHVDATQIPGGDPAGAIRQLAVEYRLDVAETILEKRREAIRAAFLNDRIQLAGGPQMTATEVIARERKQNLILGPVHGRLENEFLGPLVDRVFLLLLRNGRLVPPESLAGRELRAKYISPISRAQRKGEAEAFALAQQYLAPAIQADSTILDNFDLNRVARDSQDLFGYPQDYLRPEAAVAQMRKKRAEQQQAAVVAQAALAAGGAAV